VTASFRPGGATQPCTVSPAVEAIEQPARPDDLCSNGADPCGQLRSAVTTTAPWLASATAAIVSSPSAGACTTATPSSSASAAPVRAWPSSTIVTGAPSRPAVTDARTRSVKTRAAPGRSRHHPVGREPITLAAAITSTRTGSHTPPSPGHRRRPRCRSACLPGPRSGRARAGDLGCMFCSELVSLAKGYSRR